MADSVPAQLQNVLVSSSAGGCSNFPCVLGNLAPDGSATILVAGVVAQSVTSAFTNTASLSTGTALASGSVTSDTATVNVTAQADLAFALASTPTTIAGTTALVTATVSNHGPSAAEGAVVTITLPPGTSYTSENLPAGWSVASSVGATVVLTTSNSLASGSSVGPGAYGSHRANGAAGDESAIQRCGDGAHQRPESNQQQR
ncbi:MAG: hypothetical protein IPM07_21350 [Anaerolineales bacterium]|nr:hypothetical protein [Anaerolineales bacterium]